MKLDDMNEGQLVQIGRNLYEVSSIFRASAVLRKLYPPPKVHPLKSFSEMELILGAKDPTENLVDKYDEYYASKENQG